LFRPPVGSVVGFDITADMVEEMDGVARKLPGSQVFGEKSHDVIF